jgi:hypothetical protein
MPIELLVPLISQVGIPLATQLITLWEKGGNVSSAQFNALMAQTQVSARQILINQLNAAGVPLTDPHAVALLALVP